LRANPHHDGFNLVFSDSLSNLKPLLLPILAGMVGFLVTGCVELPVRSRDELAEVKVRERVDRPSESMVAPCSYEEEGEDLPEPEEIEIVPLEVIEESANQPSSSGLTLAEFEAMAMQHSPALATAMAREEMARGGWVQAGVYPNTVVGYSGGEIGILDTAGKQGAFVRQRFVTGGKLRLDRAVAAGDVAVAETQAFATHGRVLTDVRIRFVDVLTAQREVELARQLVEVGEASVKASRQLADGDQIEQTAVLQAEIEAENTRLLHETLENRHSEAWRRLAVVVGLPDMTLQPVEGRLAPEQPRLAWEQVWRIVLCDNPELASAQARVEKTRWAIDRARRERIPDVDVMLTVRHDNPTGDDTANVQVGLPVPLLNRNQGNIHRAEWEHSAACSDLQRLELAIKDRLAGTYRRYEDAAAKCDRLGKRILPKAEESLGLVQTAFREGQTDYLTLLTAQRTFFRTSLSYLTALRELNETTAELEGQLLTGSLQPK